MIKSVLKAVYRKTPFKQSIFGAMSPLRLPRALTTHLRFKGVVTIPIGRRSIRMHNDYDLIESDLFWSGFGKGWEGTSLNVWVRLASSSSLIVDVGANTGIYCLAAQAVNPAATVVAFEPLERVHRRLTENVLLNRQDVRIEQLAVSDHNGNATLYEDKGDHSVASVAAPPPSTPDPVMHVVATTRLDSYLDARGYVPDLIKVDVEGHEVAVLRGLGLYLARAPTIVVEILSERAATQLDALPLPVGYRRLQVHEQEGVVEVPHLMAGRSTHRNFVLCTNEIAADLITTFGRNASV